MSAPFATYTWASNMAETTIKAAREPNYTGLYIAIGITVLAIIFCTICIILACCGCGWWTCCNEDDWD